MFEYNLKRSIINKINKMPKDKETFKFCAVWGVMTSKHTTGSHHIGFL